MFEFLTTLGTIAGMLALNQAMTGISMAKNKKEELTADDIIKAINSMITEARNRGSDALTDLNNRLSKISMPFGMSPSVKNYLSKVRRDLNHELTTKTKSLSAVEQKLNDAEQRATNLANQSEEYRYLYGQSTLDDIKKDAQEAIDESNKILGVEKNVQN